MHSAFLECASLYFLFKVKHSLDAHLELVNAHSDLETFEMYDLATSSTKNRELAENVEMTVDFWVRKAEMFKGT